MAEQKTVEPRYAYRLPPCPAYDMEGTESWLAAMAERGFVLSHDGFFCGIGIFEKTEPRALRFRLEAAPKERGALSEDAPPSEEAAELYASYGWQYVAARGQFLIYCADSPDARELNTDPKVQALTLKLVRKRERSNLFVTLFWVLVYPLLTLRLGFVRAAIILGVPMLLWTLGIILWAVIRSAKRMLHLHRLGKMLQQGEPLNHKKDWRARALRDRVGRVIYPVVLLAWLICLLALWGEDLRGKHEVPLSEYTAPLPFATLQTLAPGGAYTLSNISYSNTVTAKSNWLAPQFINYAESARITLPDGAVLDGFLRVEYYETASPWLARAVAREFLREAKRSKNYEGPLPLPALAVDYAVGFIDSTHFPTVVLQRGCRAMRVLFYQYQTPQGEPMPYEEWVAVFAESLQ